MSMVTEEKRKKQIKKQLNSMKAAEVKMYHFLLRKTFLSNQDFRIVADGSWREMIEIIGEESEQKIDFSITDIANQEVADTWNLMEQEDLLQKKLKKAECIEQMAMVLGDDTMFEGFCLAFYGEDEELESLCRAWNCEDTYLTLASDPIYQKRKVYQKMIRCYTNSAINLYGIVHVLDLERILMNYEKDFMEKKDGFERGTGCYRMTLMYQPKYHCSCVLQNVIGNGIPDVLTSMDGLVIHMCFREEYLAETDRMMEHFQAYKGRELSEKELDEFFFGRAEESAYRRLLIARMDKPPYSPEKKEFLKYVSDSYREESSAQKKLQKYLAKKYWRNFGKLADKLGLTADQCIRDFVDDIYQHASDRGCQEPEDPNEVIEFVFAGLQGYGISMDIDHMNELLSYVMQMVNSVRLWRNNGYTPMEIAKMYPVHPNNLTVVPGSTMAAEGLKEIEKELKQMGIQVDTQQTATEIPTYSYPNGINGTAVKGTKKVYPNDPCPCGSGKKFKKCCGKFAK